MGIKKLPPGISFGVKLQWKSSIIADGGGVRSDLPKFKFSVEFPIGLYVILQLQILKKSKLPNIVSAKLFSPKIHQGATLHQSRNNVERIFFYKYGNTYAVHATVT